MMLKFILLFVFLSPILARYSGPFAWWDTDSNKEYSEDPDHRIPFPQCLVSGSKSKYFGSSHLQQLFQKEIEKEAEYLKNERYENYKHDNYGTMDYGGYDEAAKARTAAAAAIKLTREVMTALACNLTGTDKDNLQSFLSKFTMPEELCSNLEQIDCTGKEQFRTSTGICNNNEHPYYGSAGTAFDRILNAEYDDYLSEPRRRSKRGGYLPQCRKISLALGSKPIFDRNYNNFFVIFGQYIAHDIALATPVTDTYSSPISSCKCDSTYDWNKCTVIEVEPDDPYLRGQKCMAFPATAQAFKNQVCSLGVKEQKNSNTHFLDCSNIYGNSERSTNALRGENGLLKSTIRSWSKKELPPIQREGKSCNDATSKRFCFAGGDSRLMENLLFTGIHTMFLRLHNAIAVLIQVIVPDATSNEIFEATRKLVIDIHQIISFGLWVPTLLGPIYGDSLLNTLTSVGYDPSISAAIFNEVSTATFRLHSLVRDLYSRCTPDAKRIDQLWLHDISHKSKYAYDMENNGLDSILCGSLYDYGFAPDGNFAHQIHHRLFESTNKYGSVWRNDLVSINICRGREHGLASYNAYREHYGYKRAYYFEDFGDTINYNGIKLLEKLYKDPEDVDFYVGINLEDIVDGGFVGPIAARMLEKQFENLCRGDRFCAVFQCGLTKDRLQKWAKLLLRFLFCTTVDIQQVPTNVFKPLHDIDNPLVECSTYDGWGDRFTKLANSNTLTLKTLIDSITPDFDAEGCSR